MGSDKKKILNRRRQQRRKKNKAHVLKRAKDRFGLNLAMSDLNEITRKIKSGKMELLKTEIRQSGVVEWYRVVLGEDIEAVALFDCRLRSIATLMPSRSRQNQPRQFGTR